MHQDGNDCYMCGWDWVTLTLSFHFLYLAKLNISLCNPENIFNKQEKFLETG